jgi:pellino
LDGQYFKIGRSSENQIDCIVMDTVPGAKTFDDLTVPQSTISRYACRIVVSRHPPYTACLYAAGFDGSKNIFLGVRSIVDVFSSIDFRSTGEIDQMEK